MGNLAGNESFLDQFLEMLIQGLHTITAAGLDADGNAYLAAHLPSEMLTVVALPGVLGPANLGQKISIWDHRYDRTVEKNVIITGMEIMVDSAGHETITPTLRVVT